MLAGPVTRERVGAATAGRHFDVLHLAGRATVDGFLLSEGDIMGPAEIAQVAKHIRCSLVFLNVCPVLYLPQYLVDQRVPAVLSHTREVLDEDAIRLAAYYYEELGRNNGDYHAAYEAVNPRNGTLSWHSNGAFFQRSLVAPLIQRMDEHDMHAGGVEEENGMRFAAYDSKLLQLDRAIRQLVLGVVANSVMTTGVAALALFILYMMRGGG